MPLLFEDAAKAKSAIMVSQQKEIQKLYDDWADDILDKAWFYSHKTNASATLSERYYKELYKQMKAQSDLVGKEIQGLITSNMYTIADSVVASNVNWLKEFGFSEDGLNAAFSYIPHDVVQRLVTGQIYQGGWNLSQRIWSDSQQTQRDIYQVMARGLAEQKSVYEIAKDLESYVRPGAKLPWNPVLAMRNTKTGEIEYKRIYKKQVDYNAQRLARTLAQHSYQQSFIATTEKNPFITSYRWHSNGSRVCELCLARDGKVFKKDELPMDHPNGMCTMEPVIVDDMVEQLADWFNSPDGTYPEIDVFAGNFGYEAKKGGTVEDFIAKYGKSTKSPNAWFSSLTHAQKAEAKLLKEQSGLTWNKWYEQNIYAGDGSNLGGKKAATIAKYSKSDIIKMLESGSEKDYHAVSQLFAKHGFNLDDFFDDYGVLDFDTTMFKEALAKVTGDVAKPLPSYLSKFTKDTIPSKYKDFYVRLSLEEKAEFQANFYASLSIDFSKLSYDQQLKAIQEYYEKTVLAKIAPDTIKATTATTKIITKTDDVFDAAKWYDSIRKNDLSMMDEWTKDWLKNISPEERDGIVTYTSNAFENMNRYLRGMSRETRYADEIEAARSALSKASLPQETIVRRGSGYNMLESLGMGAVTKDNVGNFIGAVVEDKGFVSTSPSPRGGFPGTIEYVIKLPKGSQAMYVDSISRYQGEQELLINCGGKFVVEDVEIDDWGYVTKIYMTLINLQ